MPRNVLYLILILSISACTSKTSQKDSQIVKAHQDYFEQQKLPYRPVQGCVVKNSCIISADFNNDNILDLAGLYEYTGPQHRYKNQYLDLVIIYSDEKYAETRHVIFSHVGKVDDKNNALAKLTTQKKGIMKVPSGDFDLKTPGINVVAFDQVENSHFPTFYWHETKFYSVLKAL